MDIKIVLCVVENRETILIEYAKWLVKMALSNKIYGILFKEGKRKAIWSERRRLIDRALKSDCTHVLFVDTDVIPPDDFLEKLVYTDCDMVSGIYYDVAGNPCSRKNGDYYNGKILEDVDVCSMGLSLIKREVLEKVPYPEPDPVDKIDADAEFCKAVKEAGFTLKQDFELRGHHLLLGNY